MQVAPLSKRRSSRTIVVGTRGSPLALAQSRWVVTRLSQLYPELDLQVKRIKTQGDILRKASLVQIGGKGVFVKEIEEALLSGEIDLAVHSLKDLPITRPPGLIVGAVSPREDPRDVLLSTSGDTLADLPQGAVVGTSSLRRRVQLLACRPDLVIREIRGNVDTRLRKVESREYDAIVLAAAGLQRLGYPVTASQYLPLEVMLPAVGQGALVVETRDHEPEIVHWLKGINDPITETATRAERVFLAAFGGGCAVPIAAYGDVEGETLFLRGMVASVEAQHLLRDELAGPSHDPQTLGQLLAERLLARGADKIISEVTVEP